MKILLTREQFRNECLKRDGNKCVVCGSGDSVVAHHILERRLFDKDDEKGGYFLENGATLCGKCHIDAEQTTLSCETIREKAGIKSIIIPCDFGYDETYDKWGNPILLNGSRMMGELFFDASVQKILEQGGVLSKFTKYVKYPKTKHLPWSEGQSNDDKTFSEEDIGRLFYDKDVVVTEKLDGENSSLYTDIVHARSIDGRNHASRNWLKNFHSTLKCNIPDGWRICGENLFAKHSIFYENLPSYFIAFAIFNEKNICLSYADFLTWCDLLDICPAPILYKGKFDVAVIKSLYSGKSVFDGSEAQEGYVVRLSNEISFSNYSKSIAKFVRKNHVQSSHNWMNEPIIKNRLRIS